MNRLLSRERCPRQALQAILFNLVLDCADNAHYPTCLRPVRYPFGFPINERNLNISMKKFIAILVPLSCGCLLAACAGIGLKEQSFTQGGKFAGNHTALARCVVNELQSDSRWTVRALQYQVFSYPHIAATEIYAYPEGALTGTYARNSPSNPDAVIRYGLPTPRIHAGKSGSPNKEIDPDYSFVLTLKRTDNATVFATVSGRKYESGIAWGKLRACSTPE